jgi:hypothetical protein
MRRSAPLAGIAWLVLAALLGSLSGCCSLARLFCGPDRTPWIWPDFETPEKTVRTALEALRRDDPEAFYVCLSNGYRDRTGLDMLTTMVVFQQQNPGLHLAGYAEVPEATRVSADRAEMVLDVEGHVFDVRLVRDSLWEVRYERPNGTLGDFGRPIGSWPGIARVVARDDPERDESVLTIQPLTFGHFGLDEVPLEHITRFTVERRWKIDAVTPRESP